ncbi:HAD family hydrolase [Scytonema millei]|uniref:HAD family phosphatase n=1 Tax=Scytonema millei VB511283 TaxID=1245923 RepID=A0A9X5I698_9CYAN|nr:HAD family hydrolase [Scytonema millei]NHC36509.1 HAD family phosphatase [Scytonema millei VB511283]
MGFTPLEQIDGNFLKNIKIIATDMDGTLTQKGKFTSDLLLMFEKLAVADIQVLIVTGRSAGWVSGLVNYLPIAGAIAENGGLFYSAGNEEAIALTSISNRVEHRQELAAVFQKLQQYFPQIRESSDNCFRITDWTFAVRGLGVEQLNQLSNICQELGWGFTYSNVQCHIKPLNQDKANGLMQILQDYFQCLPEQVLTVGDSPNDESLFNPQCFPFSIGVANALEYADRLNYQPSYITKAIEGQGFCELAREIFKVSGKLSN